MFVNLIQTSRTIVTNKCAWEFWFCFLSQ